jgi:hypothetical protein
MDSSLSETLKAIANAICELGPPIAHRPELFAAKAAARALTQIFKDHTGKRLLEITGELLHAAWPG